MTTNPVVVEELREMFRVGSTPSQLVRYIVEHHQGEEHLVFLIQDYFREAFDVAIVRGVGSFDVSALGKLRYAFLNDDLLHEMVEKQSTWNRDANHRESGNAAWLAGLTATSLDDHFHEAASGMAELSNLWNRLDPKEQAVLQRLIAGNSWKYEQLQILIQLAERLQQRVNELEGQLEKVSEPAKG